MSTTTVSIDLPFPRRGGFNTIDIVPQEVWDEIIDNVYKRSLKACSLTCRRWVPRARKHLFKKFVLNKRTKPWTSLLQLWESSSRIVPFAQYVKQLAIHDNSISTERDQQALQVMCAKMIKVHELRLCSIDFSHRFVDHILRTLHSALPNVKVMRLHNIMFPSLSDIPIFLHPFRNLSTLVLHKVSAESIDLFDDALIHAPPGWLGDIQFEHCHLPFAKKVLLWLDRQPRVVSFHHSKPYDQIFPELRDFLEYAGDSLSSVTVPCLERGSGRRLFIGFRRLCEFHLRVCLLQNLIIHSMCYLATSSLSPYVSLKFHYFQSSVLALKLHAILRISSASLTRRY